MEDLEIGEEAKVIMPNDLPQLGEPVVETKDNKKDQFTSLSFSSSVEGSAEISDSTQAWNRPAGKRL